MSKVNLTDGWVALDCVLFVGVLIFTFAIIIAIRNVVIFRRQMTQSLVVFYSVTILTMIIRIFYFIAFFFKWNDEIIATLLVLPGTLTISIAMTQTNMYIQLIL